MSANPSVLTREAGTSAPSPKSRRRRLSLAHLLIVLAAALAFALNYLALQSRDSMVLVAVAGSDLAIGTAISEEAIRLESVPASLVGLDGLVTESEVAASIGWIVGVPVAEGDLIQATALSPPATASGLRLMSIPVAVEHAAGGSILPGDTVDVIAVLDGMPTYVATSIEVVDVGDVSTGGLASNGFFLTLAVDPDQALALALAVDAGSIDVVRSTGADPVVERSDAQP